MKTCTKCGEVKALEDFRRDKGKKDGLRSICKQCNKVIDAAYAKANPGKNKARVAVFRAANPEKIKARRADHYAANLEKYKTNSAAVSLNLSRAYVANRLCLPAASLTPELYALKREQLETSRLAKQLRHATKEQHASI